MLNCFASFWVRLLTRDEITDSIVDFTKTVEELYYHIFYIYTSSCIHFFSSDKKLNFKGSRF